MHEDTQRKSAKCTIKKENLAKGFRAVQEDSLTLQDWTYSQSRNVGFKLPHAA